MCLYTLISAENIPVSSHPIKGVPKHIHTYILSF